MKKRVHFVGIGGIGMSSLAQFFAAYGSDVSGSDSGVSVMLEPLRRAGIQVSVPHLGTNITTDIELVVYSAAISKTNVELERARFLGIRCAAYAEVLGTLTQDFFTIAVSGSHGKSTTTSLIALGMIAAGLDPTVIVGAQLNEFGGTNFRKGNSSYLVIEADECNRAFLHYQPRIAVITSIDAEHLETYGDINKVIAGFQSFCEAISPEGMIVADVSQPACAVAVSTAKCQIVHYDSYSPQFRQLQIIGKHNQANAEAASCVLAVLNVHTEVVDSAFLEFTGVRRRLERLHSFSGILGQFVVVSDYAHHPTAIRTGLKALREHFPSRQLVCVFQPHLQDKLSALYPEHLTAFNEADHLMLLPTYNAYELHDFKPGQPWTSEELCHDINSAWHNTSQISHYATDFEEMIQLITNLPLAPGTVIVFMSAGDLDAKIRSVLGYDKPESPGKMIHD